MSACAVHFSSERHDWETPQAFFEKVNAEFDLDLDVCALVENTKLPRFLSPVSCDSLQEPWAPSRCWMNPPYGRTIGKWVRKAYEESRAGALVVCLVPARTDSAWWHDYAMKGEIRFIRGRLKFSGHQWNAPFPCALVIFRPHPSLSGSKQ